MGNVPAVVGMRGKSSSSRHRTFGTSVAVEPPEREVGCALLQRAHAYRVVVRDSGLREQPTREARMDATALAYGTVIALWVLLNVWMVAEEWQHERRVRRRVQMRLRQLQRVDLGFARGRE